MPSQPARLRLGGRDLAVSSAIAFAGLTVARLLGFLFSVAAARILVPVDYGRMAYGLALAAIASVLLSSSPIGLSRFLARENGDLARQNVHFSNWLGVVGVLLATSLLMLAPISWAGGLGGWMVVGVGANLVGTAVLETYREAQRGVGRYGLQALFYSLANLLQLVGIVVAAGLGWSSWPLVLQSVFFAIWFGADLVLVQHMLPAAATGDYAAAKTLANAVWMAPAAIGMVLVPMVARLPVEELRRRLPHIVVAAALVTVPGACALALGGRLLIRATFGDAYPDAAAPLALLGLGMAMHGLYLVFFSIWVGIGRPLIDLVATAAGMTCTVGAAFLLIPHGGLLGAATAFTLGATLRLGVIVVFTIWSLHLRSDVGGTVAANLPETPMVRGATGGRDWSRWDGEPADA